jgi:hypothetical protein
MMTSVNLGNGNLVERRMRIATTQEWPPAKRVGALVRVDAANGGGDAASDSGVVALQNYLIWR